MSHTLLRVGWPASCRKTGCRSPMQTTVGYDSSSVYHGVFFVLMQAVFHPSQDIISSKTYIMSVSNLDSHQSPPGVMQLDHSVHLLPVFKVQNTPNFSCNLTFIQHLHETHWGELCR